MSSLASSKLRMAEQLSSSSTLSLPYAQLMRDKAFTINQHRWWEKKKSLELMTFWSSPKAHVTSKSVISRHMSRLELRDGAWCTLATVNPISNHFMGALGWVLIHLCAFAQQTGKVADTPHNSWVLDSGVLLWEAFVSPSVHEHPATLLEYALVQQN